MIGALISGDLVADPVERTTRKGERFVTATARVPAGDDAVFVGIAAFDAAAADRLAKLRKGSPVSAAGVLEQTSWTTQAGEVRTGWRLTASEVLSAYQATKKRREVAE